MAKLRTRGVDAIKKADAARGGRFGKYNYFDLDEGASGIFRILLERDVWPAADVHMAVPTRPEPPNQKNWPPAMSAVCMKDAANFRDPDTEVWDEGYGECWIHDFYKGKKNTYGKAADKASLRCWVPAVEREQVTDPGSGEKVVRDKKTADGKIKIVLINQSWFAFFSQLATIGIANGSVTDRDMYIVHEEKTGGQAFAPWRIIPRDKDPEMIPGTPAWQAWEKALKEQKLTLDDLTEVVLNMSSERYYQRFFRADLPFPAEEGDEEEGSTENPAQNEGAPGPEVADDDLAAMKARMDKRLAEKG